MNKKIIAILLATLLHFEQFKRKEHYSITEKGRKVFSLVQQLINETT